ncbi:hypothetical protein DYB26_006692 [Aphanomyces astaci]|uniref:Uncharacterized protein n=1 Tax=Aphanomyces astaci TaxID=112090 RepID=A0A3R7AWG4_APHAT|nr:hypothetical protein DYB26_006692 [Aphanomyces astaci]
MEQNTYSQHNPAQTADDSLDALYEEPGAYAESDLKANRRFKADKDGQGCKTCFDKLTKAYKERSFAAMRRSGTDEEFNECEQLLEGILSQVNDFVEKNDAQASPLAAKKDGIESSGVMMRKLAMECQRWK